MSFFFLSRDQKINVLLTECHNNSQLLLAACHSLGNFIFTSLQLLSEYGAHTITKTQTKQSCAEHSGVDFKPSMLEL